MLHSHSKLPRLYAIVDTVTLHQRAADPMEIVEGLLEGGVRLLQFRHKGHFPRPIFATAQKIAVLCQQAQATLVVDDRADIAMLLNCGVHVGQDDLPPRDVRALLGPAAFIGFSTHNQQQLTAADSEPVDYVAIGPIFATGSKQNPDPVIGLDHLAELRAVTRKPLVAIGGITIDTAPALIRARIDSVAVISGLLPPHSTRQTVRAMAQEWILRLEDVL